MSWKSFTGGDVKKYCLLICFLLTTSLAYAQGFGRLHTDKAYQIKTNTNLFEPSGILTASDKTVQLALQSLSASAGTASSSAWDALTDPSGNSTIAMGSNNTSFTGAWANTWTSTLAGTFFTLDGANGQTALDITDGNLLVNDTSTFTGTVNLSADSVNTITEIATALKSGADGTVVTGTKGDAGKCAEWNADGDLVEAASAAACGTGGTTNWSTIGDPTKDGTIAMGTNNSAFTGAWANTWTSTLSGQFFEIDGVNGQTALNISDGNLLVNDTSTFTGTVNLSADSVNTITEIAAALKTGADGTLATGTAGSNGEIASWNTDGDVVDSNLIVSTLTDERVCEYESTGTFLICDTVKDASGACASGSLCSGGHEHELNNILDPTGDTSITMAGNNFAMSGANTSTWTSSLAGTFFTLDGANGQVALDITDGNLLVNDTSTFTGTVNLSADSVNTITEIAAALKSGSDGTVITGTAGGDGLCAEFNADGDLVEAASAAACGTGGTTTWSAIGDPTKDNAIAMGTNNTSFTGNWTNTWTSDLSSTMFTINGVDGQIGVDIIDGDLQIADTTNIGGAAGVALDATNGKLAMTGLGSGGTAEDFTIDLDFSNLIQFSSTSGAGIQSSIGYTQADGVAMKWGNLPDSQISYNTTGLDSLNFGLVVGADTSSGYVSIMELADDNDVDRQPLANTANPTLRIYSSDAAVATDYIEFFHDADNGIIQMGAADINLEATTVKIGNGATAAGILAIQEDTNDGANNATFTVPTLAADTDYILPPDDGDNTEVLQTNGTGTLTWVANAGGGTTWSDIGDPTTSGNIAMGSYNSAFAGAWANTWTSSLAGVFFTIDGADGQTALAVTDGNVVITDTFTANGINVLGDGADNFSVASDGIDISTSGVVTNGSFDSDNNTFTNIALSETNITAGTGINISTDTVSYDGTYDEIGNAGTTASMDFTSNTNTWTSSHDGATFFTISDGDTALAADTELLELNFSADGDAEGIFLIMKDNVVDEVFKVEAEGKTTIGNATTNSSVTFGNGYTADPCGTLAEGALFYNTTADEFCYCDGSSVDLRIKDSTTACF